MDLTDRDTSIERLPDNVVFTIINKVQFLEDLFSVCLVNRRWYELGQYRLQQVKHIIGIPKEVDDDKLTVNDSDTLLFRKKRLIPCASRVKRILPKIETVLVKETLDYDKPPIPAVSTPVFIRAPSLSECGRALFPSLPRIPPETKGYYIYEDVKLTLFEPSVEIQLNDLEVKYLKTFLDLIYTHGEHLESLTILTLNCHQLKLLSHLMTGNNLKVLNGNHPKYPEDVTHLTIGIPVWYDFRYLLFRCPRLQTLYFLARDSWNLASHHQFDSFQHINLRNLFLEFWINDYCHIKPSIYTKMFPKLRQLAIRDHPKLDDSGVYSLLVSLRYLDNLDVRGCPRVSPSTTEKIIWNAQCDLPHRVNYFCGTYSRVNYVQINADFIFTSWRIGTINPFDLYSLLTRQLINSGQRVSYR